MNEIVSSEAIILAVSSVAGMFGGVVGFIGGAQIAHDYLNPFLKKIEAIDPQVSEFGCGCAASVSIAILTSGGMFNLSYNLLHFIT